MAELESLKDNYSKIISVLSAHQIAFWEYDILTQRCIFGEDYFKVLGLEQAGIRFENIEQFTAYLTPEDAANYRSAFQHILDSEKNVSKLRACCIGKHGEKVWLEDHFISYKKNELGVPEKLVAYTVNVTSECEKENQLRNLEERYRKILQALPNFIFIFDRQLHFIDVMKSDQIQLFHTLEELIGADGKQIFGPGLSETLLTNIRECLENGNLREIEYFLEVEGVKHYFQGRMVPFEQDKVLMLVHDINERIKRTSELIVAKEKAEEADRMKSTFLASISHEIRTPLNAIVGFSEMVILNEEPEEQEEYIRIIRKNSELLLQLIDDILDLSRLEVGKTEMNFEEADLAELLREVDQVYKLKQTTEVAWKVSIPDHSVISLTDRHRVMQVLFNFLSNAFKNTATGCVSLEMEEQPEWIVFQVRDTGCGIAEEKIPLIFKRFEKLNDFVQGTGLGLPICLNIAERLGGRIEVSSEVGKGSVFSFYLPYLKKETEKEMIPGCTEISPGLSYASSRGRSDKKILFLHREEKVFLELQALLGDTYSLFWVNDAQELVRTFLLEKPDMVLLDVPTPLIEGVRLVEKIRSFSSRIPIVALTANNFYVDRHQLVAAGCEEVVFHPYSVNKLKDVISATL